MTDGAETAEMAEIADRVAAFEDRLAQACAAALRPRDSVHLIAVTKNHSAQVAAHAVTLGLHDLGENRPQELAAHRDGVTAIDRALAAQARWHFIGRLQRNKARQVVQNSDLVHSIDRVALVDAVAKATHADDQWSAERPLPILLQINLDPSAVPIAHDSSADRGGVHPHDLAALADHALTYPTLRVRGVMAVAPLGLDADECFARLRTVSEKLRQQVPDADLISAGMTGDFVAAIANGATHVRVGTALFGARRLA